MSVGNKTLKKPAVKLITIPAFVRGLPPTGEKAILEYYGDPFVENEHWFMRNMVFYDLPAELKALWGKKGIWVHRWVKYPLSLALDAIIEAKLTFLIKEFNGVYNLRKIRGGDKRSFHAFGAAIDLNATQDPMGDKKIDMDEQIVEIFESIGWTWGGRWEKPDAMHFEWGHY